MKEAAFPEGFYRVGENGYFDGVDLGALAKKYGTPLYVVSETSVRARCAQLREAFLRRYSNTRVYYASKAFQTLDMLRALKDEDFGIDVVSGGELFAALRAGIHAENIIFHGNAKTDEELRAAVQARVGRIAIDNLEEIFRIEREASIAGTRQALLFRVTPGVDSHTHRFISTGSLDSKFGIPLEQSETERYIDALKACPHVEFFGLHFHIGSQLLENTSHLAALKIVLDFAGRLSKKYGLEVRELNMGGGFGIRYLPKDSVPSISDFIDPMMAFVVEWSSREKLPMPHCAIEPGRWIVGEAGLTLYKVIATKAIPGIRTYVAVDGGLGDNIRPALYEARYHAEIVEASPDAPPLSDRRQRTVTIAGRYCESGDILARDIKLPEPGAGDILALFSTGAYCYAMSSNYNRVPRPALVMLRDATARLSIRRETYDDLLSREM